MPKCTCDGVVQIGVHKIVERAMLPVRATGYSACYDVSACLHHEIIKVNGKPATKPKLYENGTQITIFAGDRVLVPTGLIFTMPPSYKIAVYPRSGMAFNEGITVVNSPGTIDADYNRELFILLVNLSPNAFVLKDGMRIAQIEIVPVITDRVSFNLIDMQDVEDARKNFENGQGISRLGGIGHTGTQKI